MKEAMKAANLLISKPRPDEVTKATPVGVNPEKVGSTDWLSEKEAVLDLLRLIYDEQMTFGWGWDECHDRVYQMLLKYGRIPIEEVDASFSDNVGDMARRDSNRR